MTFYVATSLDNAPAARAAADALRARGLAQTYDWTVHGSVQAEPERWSRVALDEGAGVLRAAVVLVLLPGGRGTHVELGLALASSRCRLLLLVGDDAEQRACVFHHHPFVRRAATLDDALAILDREAK